jgi:hypothetical protein
MDQDANPISSSVDPKCPGFIYLVPSPAVECWLHLTAPEALDQFK